MDIDSFHLRFSKEVLVDKNWDRFSGYFALIIGIGLIILFQLNVIEYSGTTTYFYFAFSVLTLLGMVSFYWTNIKYSVSVYKNEIADTQIEKGIHSMKAKYNMDLLKHDGTYYCFFFKSNFWLPWTEVHLFYDSKNIYINARLLSRAIVDFGYSKRLERKLIELIKTSR